MIRSWMIGVSVLTLALGSCGYAGNPEDTGSQAKALAGDCTVTIDNVSPASPVAQGSTISFTVSATCTGGAEPEFSLYAYDGVSWTNPVPYTTDTTLNFDTTGLALGEYFFQVWARRVTNPDGVNWEGIASTSSEVTAGSCSGVVLAADQSSPLDAGVNPTVNLTATPTCDGGVTPEYQFYGQGPDGIWRVLQAWSTSNSYAWDAASALTGVHQLVVWVRAQGASSLQASDGIADFEVQNGAAVCFAPQVAASPTSPQAAGATIDLTLSSTCIGGATPEYRLFAASPAGQFSELSSGYSTSTSYQWATNAQTFSGEWFFIVWLRNVGNVTAYDAAVAAGFTITGGTTPPDRCTSVSLGASPTSPQNVGTPVTYTALATCEGTEVPEYAFYLLDTTGTWTLAQSYSATATFDWTTTGLPAGDYRVQVWARAQGSIASQESVGSLAFTLE
jgi:hypothetical protein